MNVFHEMSSIYAIVYVKCVFLYKLSVTVSNRKHILTFLCVLNQPIKYELLSLMVFGRKIDSKLKTA